MTKTPAELNSDAGQVFYTQLSHSKENREIGVTAEFSENASSSLQLAWRCHMVETAAKLIEKAIKESHQ